MADWHILGMDQAGNSATVVMHFAVPGGNNNAGISYQTAVLEMQGGGPVQSALLDAGVEQADLDSGALYERVVQYSGYAAQGEVEKRDAIDALYTALNGDLVALLSTKLGYWGYSHDVA